MRTRAAAAPRAVLVLLAVVTLMALGLGAIAVLDAEQNSPGANITTFGDALWWSATTVTPRGSWRKSRPTHARGSNPPRRVRDAADRRRSASA